jgi:hypothetical protein
VINRAGFCHDNPLTILLSVRREHRDGLLIGDQAVTGVLRQIREASNGANDKLHEDHNENAIERAKVEVSLS